MIEYRVILRNAAAKAAAFFACCIAIFASTPLLSAPQKVLRIPLIIAETHFDPAQTSDTYSHSVMEEIFDAPLGFDMLARPAKIKPVLLEAIPEVSDGGKEYTLKFKKGILFQDDVAFKGKPRELIAADFAYSLKRLLDPANKSPNSWYIEDKILGLDALAASTKKNNAKFNYDAPLEGLELIDRYTLRIKLAKPDYTFLYAMATSALSVLAREVVEHYGARITDHPVGTGPFKLAQWTRKSKIVLERNPTYREEYYEADPPADDPLSQQLFKEMKGKRLPQVDRVEIAIIEESQPRWLAFLNQELDWVQLPYEFNSQAVDSTATKVNDRLAKRGVRIASMSMPDIVYMYYNMKDPLVGGYTPEKIALRRAINMAFNNNEEVNLIRNGMAVIAQSPIPPGLDGYDPDYRHVEPFNPSKAKALLDTYGYVDRDGDGWREMPDGSPLKFVYPSEPSQLGRLFMNQWKKNMNDIGIRIEFLIEHWPELRKMSKQGKLQVWELAWTADYPDAQNIFQLLYGPNCGSSNDGCFELKAFDDLYDKAAGMKPSLERTKIYNDMKRLVAAYAPLKFHSHRKRNDLMQPWVLGWRKHPFTQLNLRYVDVDIAMRDKALSQR